MKRITCTGGPESLMFTMRYDFHPSAKGCGPLFLKGGRLIGEISLVGDASTLSPLVWWFYLFCNTRASFKTSDNSLSSARSFCMFVFWE